MFVRQKTVKEVGAWDENYFFYGEDLDFYYRIHNAGWQNIFYAKPLLDHYKGASSGLRKESQKITKVDRETRIKVAKASVRGMETFYKKFYSKKYPSWLTAFILFGIKVRGSLRIINHYLK